MSGFEVMEVGEGGMGSRRVSMGFTVSRQRPRI